MVDMSQIVIENPIINTPFAESARLSNLAMTALPMESLEAAGPVPTSSSTGTLLDYYSQCLVG
jgi:hypothetical protein